MRRILALVVVIVLAGCAAHPQAQAQNADAIMQAAANALRQKSESGEITYLKRSQDMREIHTALYPNDNVIGPEYWSYHAMLSGELDARRITWQQFEYSVTAKSNELNERARAQLMQILPYAIQQQQRQEAARQRAFKPWVPPPTYNTNCTTDPWGNTNCTTRRQ